MKNINLDVNVKIQQSRKGKIVKEQSVHNQVVNNGLDRVADLIGGFSSAAFTHVAIGTGNTAETATDLSLETEFTRESVSPTDEGTGVIEYDHEFTVGSGVSESITEAGLFDQAGESGSTMLNRATFDAFTLDSNNLIRIIITITITTA